MSIQDNYLKTTDGFLRASHADARLGRRGDGDDGRQHGDATGQAACR